MNLFNQINLMWGISSVAIAIWTGNLVALTGLINIVIAFIPYMFGDKN